MENMSDLVSNSTDGAEGLFIYTFGCQMNEHDSLKMQRILEGRYKLVDSPEKAALVLINTCSVRDKPEHKVYSLLGRLRVLKMSRPGLLIGVAGCVAQQEGEKIVKRNSAVDFVFGTHNLSILPALIDRRKAGLPAQVAVDYRDEWESIPLGFPQEGRVSVPIAISRGCNKQCSYCIVPRTRGPEVSRSVDEIEREVKLAVHRGAKEILLLGQTVNSYGMDLSPKFSFVGLLERLAAIDALKRIRFTSPHPQEMRRDLIDFMAANEKMCRHIHMPLQSGCDKILKAMNRNYRRKKYLNIIEAFHSRIADLAVTTDIIIGYPGETEADFRETLEVLEIVQFDNSYSFVFSPRPGTPAADLDDSVSFERKLEWLKEFQARQNEIALKKLQSWVTRKAEVLIDGPSTYNQNCMQGRTSQNFVVNMSPAQKHEESVKSSMGVGDMFMVDITGTSKFTLHGKISSL